MSHLAADILASAYELVQRRVQEDATHVQGWAGPEADLLKWLQERHGWTVASEYAPYYLAGVRTALLAARRNGSS